MIEISMAGNRRLQDLNPLFMGYQHCSPGHSYGPAVREYYLLHYILSGRGVYCAEGQKHNLSKGDCFLIKPGQMTRYRADREEPWHYVWIGFDGTLAQDFDVLPPVCRPGPGPFYEMRRLGETEGVRKEALAAILFQIYCEMFKDRKQEKDYAGDVYEYIRLNYMSDITVEGLARMVNLDRRYMTRLFQARYGMSLKEFIVAYRMERAAGFLQEGIPVSCVADMVGYRDACNFSKMFKKVNGKSPVQYIDSRGGRRK